MRNRRSRQGSRSELQSVNARLVSDRDRLLVAVTVPTVASGTGTVKVATDVPTFVHTLVTSWSAYGVNSAARTVTVVERMIDRAGSVNVDRSNRKSPLPLAPENMRRYDASLASVTA